MENRKNYHSDFLSEGYIENNLVISEIKLANQQVKVTLDPDRENPKMEDFDLLCDKLKKGLQSLTTNLKTITFDTAKEITDAANEQLDEDDTPFTLDALNEDLRLVDILVFAEGYGLFFISDNVLPDQEIFVQLDNYYSIEEVMVE